MLDIDDYPYLICQAYPKAAGAKCDGKLHLARTETDMTTLCGKTMYRKPLQFLKFPDFGNPVLKDVVWCAQCRERLGAEEKPLEMREDAPILENGRQSEWRPGDPGRVPNWWRRMTAKQRREWEKDTGGGNNF